MSPLQTTQKYMMDGLEPLEWGKYKGLYQPLNLAYQVFDL